jgi:hypothetical protein
MYQYAKIKTPAVPTMIVGTENRLTDQNRQQLEEFLLELIV